MRFANDHRCNRVPVFHRLMDGSQCRCLRLAALESEGAAMNTTLLVLAVLFFVIAVFAACKRDAPTATAAATGSVLLALLAMIVGSSDERDCYGTVTQESPVVYEQPKGPRTPRSRSEPTL